MFRTSAFVATIAAVAIAMVSLGRLAMGGTAAPAAAFSVGTTTTAAAPAFLDGPVVGPRGRTATTVARRPTPAPAVSRPWTWDQLAACESGNRWDAVRGVYQGGLQFDARTWDHYAPAYGFPADANLATRAQQIVLAERVLADQGARAWPTCGPRIGMTGAGTDASTLPSAGPPDDVAD